MRDRLREMMDALAVAVKMARSGFGWRRGVRGERGEGEQHEEGTCPGRRV